MNNGSCDLGSQNALKSAEQNPKLAPAYAPRCLCRLTLRLSDTLRQQLTGIILTKRASCDPRPRFTASCSDIERSRGHFLCMLHAGQTDEIIGKSWQHTIVEDGANGICKAGPRIRKHRRPRNTLTGPWPIKLPAIISRSPRAILIELATRTNPEIKSVQSEHLRNLPVQLGTLKT